MDKTLKDVIDEVIESAFQSITNLYNSKDGSVQSTRLRYATYKHSDNKDKPRLSEQELRFLFVEEFCKNSLVKKLDLHYSVETPTNGWYNFTGRNKRSGNLDMTIWQRDKVIAIIEFKAKNRSYETDLEKLTNTDEGDVLRYLVNILTNATSGTADNLKKKFNVGTEKDRRVVYLKFHTIQNAEKFKDKFPKYHKF